MPAASARAGWSAAMSRPRSGWRSSAAPGRRSVRFCSMIPRNRGVCGRTIRSAESSRRTSGGRSTGKQPLMKRGELEHVLRAAGAITGVSTWVIVGSQAILGALPDAPGELLVSQEVDLYAPDDEAASD